MQVQGRSEVHMLPVAFVDTRSKQTRRCYQALLWQNQVSPPLSLSQTGAGHGAPPTHELIPY